MGELYIYIYIYYFANIHIKAWIIINLQDDMAVLYDILVNLAKLFKGHWGIHNAIIVRQ